VWASAAAPGQYRQERRQAGPARQAQSHSGDALQEGVAEPRPGMLACRPSPRRHARRENGRRQERAKGACSRSGAGTAWLRAGAERRPLPLAQGWPSWKLPASAARSARIADRRAEESRQFGGFM